MANIISQSKEMSHEYCCTIVRVGEVKKIEGSDFLGSVMIEGREIVVRHDAVKEGDIMFYVQNECQLNYDFLSQNNEFDFSNRECNRNYKEVKSIYDAFLAEKDEEKSAELYRKAKSMAGYFAKNRRVKMTKLRGVISMGYLFSIDAMKNWYPKFDLNLEEHIGEDFDTINGVLFVKAYVPEIKQSSHSSNNKKDKNLKKYDRMVPGQFSFHYDTAQLQREMSRIKPDDIVSISTKIHGTSFILGNVLVKTPKYNNGLYKKIFAYLPKFLQFTKNVYDIVYSSRTVIKNQFIKNDARCFYDKDVWEEYYDKLKYYIPEGYTIYGEIFGYVSGSNKFIQNGYDYGCNTGENKLMIYRVTYNDGTSKKEFNILEVRDFTEDLICIMKESDDESWKNIMPIDVLYHGTLKDLYPNLNAENHWHENVLECLKKDKEHFGMEENEPLCKNKTPREGFVLRIDNDVIPEAWKLKCLKFLQKESKEIDTNVDIETEQRY